ncbi:centrosomal protein of 126 kDa isoform X2 [Oncorhynchus keta]|uniref:centrosomal protein of 126 kDa isoform X2 n=1 Tax=Oncorhynchus keta TaxID=8018 RepID=UPI00227D6420|nr:centrosomal protein of 126 kDa isoform X2 [Oncorhynchus keta]
MKALKDNFFYSIGADGVFEDDRHVLVEEQKSCRARARCFSLETNRRRKVLEERRKLWDVQEQRLRESILQQRKQRVQDATERFQRAHLPPSQRRRQSFRKSTLSIEEALNHIQGTLSLSSYTRQSPTPDRSCTSSPKPPPTPSPSLHQGTLSALEAYSKLMQDRTFSSFKNRLLFLSQLQETQLRDRDDLQDTQPRERDDLQDTQPRERDELQDTQLRDRDELQETQLRDRDKLQVTQPRERDELQGTQLRDRERDMVFLNELQDTQLWDKETFSSPQHHNVTQSESLSSLDSLEMEDGLNHNNTVQRVHSSWLGHQRHPNGPSSDLSFCPPTKSFLSGNLLIQQGKVDASPQPPRPRQTEESVEDCNSRLHQLSQATGWQSCTDQSSSQSNTITQPPLLSVSHHSLLTLSGIIDTSSIRSDNGDQHSQERESHLRGDHRVSGVVACSKASTPDRTLLEFTSCLIPEGKLEFRQQVRDPEDKYSKQLSATQVLLPGKTCSHKDLLCEALSSNPDHILSYNTKSSSGVREDTANIQPTKSTQHQSHGSKPSVENAMNNLNSEPKAGSNSEPKAGFNSEPKAGSNSEPKAMPNSKPKAGSNSEPKARTNSEPKARRNSEPKARPNSELKARRNSEPKARPNSEPKAERSKNTDPLSQTSGHCNIRSDFPKGLKSLQVEITPTHLPDTPPSPPPVAVVSTATDHKGTEVRCIKGILKKQSKYSGGNACSGIYNARHLISTKQFTMSIRDSVELTRRKGKDADKTTKKKIRWFDEIHLEEEEEMERSPITNNKCVSEYPLPPHRHSASSDHQQGQGQTVATNTPLASTGYHFTKQAWADVRVQESRLQGHQGIQERGQEAREVKVQESRLQGHQGIQERGQEARETRVEAREVKVLRGRTVCPRVPRRVRSARAGMDPVSSRSRKGTVIRPQSATEASSHVAWVTHGKVMVPRPPPRTETMEPKTHTRETDTVVSYTSKNPYNMDHSNDTTKTPYNMDHSNDTTKTPYNMDQSNSAATKAGIPVDEALCNNNTLDSLAPSQTRTHVIRADSSVISNPSKATPMSGQQDAQGEAARWGLLYHENGLCLDRTPTDEEISQLWHGVRSALATKDGDPVTVLPQARANLSRVTINGDSLINGVKAITTMGDFFLSPTNVRSVVRRQPQESRGSGARRRGTTGSGNRRLPLPSQSQAMVLITPLHSKHDLTHQHEEYAEVEAHSEGLLADSDIAKETVPSQRLEPGGGHSQHQGQSITTSHSQGHQARGHQGHQARGHQAQEQGQVSTITNISLEEQKVLLSLNRLNRRLQYVQASAGGSPADKAFPRGEAPFTEEGTGAAHRKHRTVSTDNRPRTQRRF